jgi:hypothetical protein
MSDFEPRKQTFGAVPVLEDVRRLLNARFKEASLVEAVDRDKTHLFDLQRKS